MNADNQKINEKDFTAKAAQQPFALFIKRWGASVLLTPAAVYFIASRGEFGLIDNFDLVIHEAGHFFFSFFGKFIHALGGTLMQILLPSLLVWYFYKNRYRTGVQFAMLLLGQNLINISVYAADAGARKLPLLGGGRVYHDWHYLLGEINILSLDTEIGYFFAGAAVLVFIIALLLPLIITD